MTSRGNVIPFSRKAAPRRCRSCWHPMRPLIYHDQPTHPLCRDSSGFWEGKFSAYLEEVTEYARAAHRRRRPLTSVAKR